MVNEMNERIKELWVQGTQTVVPREGDYSSVSARNIEKFAELIVWDCMMIARNWEDQLEKYKMSSESDAVGIATYRIARQFGIEE